MPPSKKAGFKVAEKGTIAPLTCLILPPSMSIVNTMGVRLSHSLELTAQKIDK